MSLRPRMMIKQKPSKVIRVQILTVWWGSAGADVVLEEVTRAYFAFPLVCFIASFSIHAASWNGEIRKPHWILKLVFLRMSSQSVNWAAEKQTKHSLLSLFFSLSRPPDFIVRRMIFIYTWGTSFAPGCNIKLKHWIGKMCPTFFSTQTLLYCDVVSIYFSLLKKKILNSTFYSLECHQCLVFCFCFLVGAK